MDESSVTTLVVATGIVQLVYITVLVAAFGARLSSRIAVMEFKVNELWSRERDGEDGG